MFPGTFSSRVIRRSLRLASLSMMLVLAHAATHAAVVAERSDGGIAVLVDGRAMTISPELAAQIRAALDDHGDNPAALTQEIAQIVRTNAQGTANAQLAMAIWLFGAFLADGDSEALGALLAGVEIGSGAVAAGALLSAIVPAETPAEAVADVAATVENPQQVSAVTP